MIPDSLRSAYLDAHYRFGDGSWSIEMRPDQPCTPLQRWMQDGGLRCIAVLTAFNPGSRRCNDAFNRDAQRQLDAAVARRGLPTLQGQNLDPAGRWPPEDSLLIGNLGMDEARGLARQFGQVAFLWSDETAVPRLCSTDTA